MRYKKTITAIGAAAVVAAAATAGYTLRAVSMPATSGRAEMTAGAAEGGTAGANASPAPAQATQLWHCGMHPQVIQDHPGFCPICHMALTPMSAGHDVTHGAGAGSGGITIDPVMVQNMGVRTAMAMTGPLVVSVQTAGMLRIPDPAIFEIVTQTNGWITQLNADTEGMHVHKGDVLFKYYSPDVHEAEAELIAAVKAFNLTKGDWVTTRRKAAQLDLDAARRKCRGLGLDDSDISLVTAGMIIPETISFRSPASGAVSEKTVVQGSAIWSGMKIMRIEEHSQLWLDAEVFENQLGAIAVGDDITATFDALPGRVYTAKVGFIYPHVEAMSRAEMVRIVFDNADQSLKPGMFAQVTVQTRPAGNVLLVPQEAVIDTGNKQVAFVALPGGHFDARQVRVGLVGDQDQVQILSGISEGESVVTSGQFLLDVESRTQEAIDKMTSPGSQGMPAAGSMPAMGSPMPEMPGMSMQKGGMP
jgi:RND family efflux transporter MFP subunit